MNLKLVKFSGAFNAIGDTVTLVIPAGMVEVALRFYASVVGRPPEIAIFAVDVVTVQKGDLIHFEYDKEDAAVNTERTFQLIAGWDLPANFKKYIGGLEFGPDKVECFVVEIVPTVPPTPIAS